MAKKTPKTKEEEEFEATSRGFDLYQELKRSVIEGGPATYPVEFGNERYRHLDGNKEEKCGVFVKILDIHNQDRLRAIADKHQKWRTPESILFLVKNAACAFDGSRMFEDGSVEHETLLVEEADFTDDIFQEAMYVNGYYERAARDTTKNSTGTPNSNSGSASANNSDAPSDNSTSPDSSPQKNGHSTEPTTT